MDIKTLIKPYCPWHEQGGRKDWERSVPSFRRPVFDQLIDDLRSIPQMLSITGPRRVGKSTLLHQIVQHLLNVEKVPPDRLVYYSLDDPAQLRMPSGGVHTLDQLIAHLADVGQTGPAYLFLDEIQKFERWEQYLKKYYDLKYPVRIVISGSASSPIFKSSRESLSGRIKDYHVLPFSFCEFVLYRFHQTAGEGRGRLREELTRIVEKGVELKATYAGALGFRDRRTVTLPQISAALWKEAQSALETYLIDGGFPEVWQLPTPDKKIEYLYDNQIQKVIYEDLVLAAEFRKPEQLKAFFISLLGQPGQEVNLASLSRDTGVSAQQIDKYLPLLEMTDLLGHASKFRASAVRVRRGNMKFYLVDLALRNAVLRIGRELLIDDSVLGLYAENLVFNALKQWKGILQLDYYRDGAKREVDFILHIRPAHYLPVEVKYRSSIPDRELRGVRYFAEKYDCDAPLVITKNREDFMPRRGCISIPLIPFLLMMG